MRILILRSVLMSFVLGSCVGSPLSEAGEGEVPAKDLEAAERAYRIQPGDRLTINVWRVPLLSQEVTVALDGAFPYPLLGNVPAEGKTVEEVRGHLTDRLGKDYLVKPLVTVTLTSRAQGFFVVGEVKNPGPYKVGERIDVYQGIIMAGGFTDFASKHVKIIRKMDGKKKVIKININQLQKEGRIDPEATIEPGDVIVVPKRLL